MPAEISAAAPLPVSVVDAVSLESIFHPGSKWTVRELYASIGSPYAVITVREVQGDWLLCDKQSPLAEQGVILYPKAMSNAVWTKMAD